MALTPNLVDDFVNLTLPLLKRVKWTDLALEYQDYISSDLIDDKKVVEEGGETIKFQVKTKNTGTARNTGMYAQDITKVEDLTISAKVPWAMQTANFSYDIYEDLFQSDRETIIKELTLRDHAAMSDLAELNEENLWTAPTGTSDTRPMGIPFWVQKSIATPDGGFNGGNPSGFTAGAAGIDATEYPRWKNWAFQYTSITAEDLVKKIKKSLAYTSFKPPVPHPELGFGKAEYNIFTTYAVQEALERLAETRNDNLGSDVARFIGRVTVGGVPIRWVPYLTANDSTNPLYGINWKVFRPFVKKGATMRRNPPKIGARQHTVREVHIDNWMNYICYNRRNCWVGSTSA
jgi:hypothetical protein